MATQDPVPDVHLLNLTLLLAIQSSARDNLADTVLRYNLDMKQAVQLRDLSFGAIANLVANLDQSVFTVRPDLVELLNMPPGLAGILAPARGMRQKKKLSVQAVTGA
jgi:hypothetical protein